VVQMESINEEESMWKREKEQSILETSEMRGPHDLVKNPPWRVLETSRTCVHMPWPRLLSRRPWCCTILTYLLDCRVSYLLSHPLELMCFCLENPKHFYITGALLHVRGLIILEFNIHIMFNLYESILLWEWNF